jgi:hypothetical protein
MILYAGVVSWMGLMLSKYLIVPSKVSKMMVNADTEASAYRSTALPIDDLKCAIGASIQWDLIDPSKPNPPYDPAVNPQFIPWFQINDPSITPPALPLSYVCYRYRASDKALLREFIVGVGTAPVSANVCAPVTADHAQEMVIIKNVKAPTAAQPLFAKDPAATNMVILKYSIPSSDGKSFATVVRSVHIRS